MNNITHVGEDLFLYDDHRTVKLHSVFTGTKYLHIEKNIYSITLLQNEWLNYSYTVVREIPWGFIPCVHMCVLQ